MHPVHPVAPSPTPTSPARVRGRPFSILPGLRGLVPTLRAIAVLAMVAAAWLAGSPQAAAAQGAGSVVTPQRLAIFLDCNRCDETFIREEMTWVDYVRDREVADVHVLVTQEQTGAGGQAQTLDLIGRGPFLGMDYSAVYLIRAGATDAERRAGLLRTLQALLVPYLMQTSLADRLSIVVEPLEVVEGEALQPVEDPWDYWTFEIYADGSASFESRQDSFNARYGIFVNRVTEEWKIQLRPFFNYNSDRFERNDRVIESTARRNGFTSYVVRSISPHWSVGGFGDVFTSTFDNVDMRFRFMPAIEYSLYPYREANRRQLTVAYRIGASHIAYADTTIYDEIEQVLPEHILNASYEVTQPWGQIDVGVNASQYLNQLERYSLRFDGSFDVRITQGLSLSVGGNVAFIQNQVNLPKGDADLEEVLLRRRQLETNYRAGLNFGFRYRFGSIYNNVVNPRLGGGGGQDRF
jgi:hypothetical protein